MLSLQATRKVLSKHTCSLIYNAMSNHYTTSGSTSQYMGGQSCNPLRGYAGATICYVAQCTCQLFAGDTRYNCTNPYCGHAYWHRKLNRFDYTKHG